MHVEAAFQEIELRVGACAGGYPFGVDDRGNVLHAIEDTEDGRFVVYKYLLLATRLNMGTGQGNNRSHAGIDGTHLLEELSAETCREYFGDRAQSMVFGTASGRRGFPKKISDLCMRIREGDGYASRSENISNQKDGKLDVVVWKHFSDGLVGKLIAFGQCKTGTSYKDTLTHLQPDSFCKKWIQSPLTLTPMRMFFVAEALRRGDWYGATIDAGLLFDRCRIVDFSNRLSASLRDRIDAWTEAAARANELPSS